MTFLKAIPLFLLLWFGVGLSQSPKEPLQFPKIPSNITMPVRIPLEEISAMVNQSVGDLIFEDHSYQDNNNDQFKVKVWKLKPIRLIGGTKQNIIIEVPLKIWAEKGIGKLGMYSYQNTTFETILYFTTTPILKNNWSISTETKPSGFKWITKPILDFGYIKVPITSFVEASLKEQQTKFCAIIDQKMEEQLNFQPYAVSAWNLFNKPIHISEEYNTWLKITPLKVDFAPFVFYKDAIDTTIGIQVYSETFTGNPPETSPLVKTVPNLNFVANLPNEFSLQTTSNIPFTEATKIAEKTFLYKTYDFREGKSTIKITGISVYGDQDRIMIEARTEGTVTGTSFISGIPVYDATKRKIVLTDTKFNLKTKNILQKAGTVLFQRKIVNMIENEYGIPTDGMEDNARKSTEESFNKEYDKGLNLNGKINTLQPSKVLLTETGMTTVIDMKAALKILIKGL